ncbi:hypothetical protein L798_13138 [Zootermopsis nevadensis]|uniref:Uncharacterized protein n=1 Tax=Zootermopsis nevadensis TaxID=136037 RepID=A0A067QSS8_ZOONE|nr:hypothetical protein L798_13138 [Zootermopsis nevadensis]
MGSCTKVLAAGVAMVLVGTCVLGRPSDPDVTNERRESRTADGFK